MAEKKIDQCRGLGGCLLRKACKRYNPKLAPTKDTIFIIERYSAHKGCPNHIPRKN